MRSSLFSASLTTPDAIMKIGLVLGSTRQPSNTSQLGLFIVALLQTQFPHLEIETIHLGTSPGHPLPLELSSVIPKGLLPSALPEAYEDIRVRQWSSTVLSWKAMLVVTPQYNHSFPAPLKNALDSLYHEFAQLPVGIVSLGGHGGSSVQEQLRFVLRSMGVRLGEKKVEVWLPREVIRTEARVGLGDEWLKKYEEDILACVGELVKLAEEGVRV